MDSPALFPGKGTRCHSLRSDGKPFHFQGMEQVQWRFHGQGSCPAFPFPDFLNA